MKTPSEKVKDLMEEILDKLEEENLFSKFIVGTQNVHTFMKAVGTLNSYSCEGKYDKCPYNIHIRPIMCIEEVDGKELSGFRIQIWVGSSGSK